LPRTSQQPGSGVFESLACNRLARQSILLRSPLDLKKQGGVPRQLFLCELQVLPVVKVRLQGTADELVSLVKDIRDIGSARHGKSDDTDM
jgi:hypothetical protein